VSPVEEPLATLAQPKLGPGRGLAGRPLGKPSNRAPTPDTIPTTASGLSGLSTAERAELDELRAEVDRLRRENEHLRQEKARQSSQIHELTNQNAQLIEDHTRDVLSIKAKETQLVRARSDEEEARQSVTHGQREIDRLKRELSRQVRASSPAPMDISEHIDNASNGATGFVSRSRSYVTSPTESIGKENFGEHPASLRSKLSSPPLTGGNAGGGSFGSSASQSQSPNRRGAMGQDGGGGGGPSGGGAESWRRAAEVTQNLKARIEMMKVSFFFISCPFRVDVFLAKTESNADVCEQAKQGLSRPH
jgi:hypothetical protein